MKNFEALHQATAEVASISQAESVLDSVDALATQALLRSQTMLNKARHNGGFEVGAPITVSYTDRNIFPSSD